MYEIFLDDHVCVDALVFDDGGVHGVLLDALDEMDDDDDDALMVRLVFLDEKDDVGGLVYWVFPDVGLDEILMGLPMMMNQVLYQMK